MSTGRTVDIVFCLDASSSMQPCFSAMQRHIGEFIASFEKNLQAKWDWRIDFVAHSAGETGGGVVFRMISLHHEDAVTNLYDGGQSARFFTSSLPEFEAAVGDILVQGDEAPLVALDTCLDFPWRPASTCHRVVVLMTDEPAEDGVLVNQQRERIPDLIEKIQQLKVLLFLVAPSSEIFDRLAQANKSEYEVVDTQGDGLTRVDFRQLLEAISKSVSVSTLQSTKEVKVSRGLFYQAKWGMSDEELRGA